MEAPQEVTVLRSFESRLRRIRGLISSTAEVIRAQARPVPLPIRRPPPEIEADPEVSAAEHVRRAYGELERANRGASEAQLFTQLRMMINRLEHGGLRRDLPKARPTSDDWDGADVIPIRTAMR